MSGLELAGLGKRFGAVWALHPTDLQVSAGEFVVIMGPSGCGKSTLLRLVAGLEEPTCGVVRIGDRDVTTAAPAARGVAMVFQSYALYPHLTVAENIAFPLKAAKRSSAEVARRVEATAQVLELGDLLHRKPRELSGGQRQRVSIGRAIVREPEVLLLDEPLSNLDAALRVRLRREFSRLHRTLNATMVYVTHDQQEAMSLADRIVVMEAGRVAQAGSPVELYERPANLAVATTIGSPPMNRLPARWTVENDHVMADFNGARLAFDDLCPPEGAGSGEAIIGVRPEHLWLDEAGCIVGEVAFRELLGGVTQVYLAGVVDDGIIAQMRPDRAAEIGERLSFSIAPGRAHLFDAETGLAFRRR